MLRAIVRSYRRERDRDFLHVLHPGGAASWRRFRHLARIAAALGPGTTGLGLDISAAAARLAARRWPGLAFAVADLWSD
jgi:hypothetical protein